MKNGVSVIVFATPRLANGVNRVNDLLKWLFQSQVTLPVLRPFFLSPVGAVTVTVER